MVTSSLSKITLVHLLISRLLDKRAVGRQVANRARVDHMLTIFGKKKKDEQTPPESLSSSQTEAQEQPSTPSQSPGSMYAAPAQRPVEYQPRPQPAMRVAPPQQSFRMSPTAPLPTEETSLTRLLQSLLQDIPLPPGIDLGFASASQTTPDYVPVRSTPPSRAMVIGPGKGSREWEEQGEESDKRPAATPAGKQTKPAEAQPPAGKIPIPTPTVSTKRDQPSEKTPEKPSKLEKQPDKPSKEMAAKKEAPAPQSFDHIFQLTQGNLERKGLVIINGEAGSGRTTLCSGLTSNYMKMGSACMYLTYDQAPSDLRDQMKKLGTDAAQYESGFRLILVDGFASQSESFSMEPYYLEQPFSFENIQETLTRNSQMFMGEKIKIIFDSLDGLASKVPAKDFAKSFTDLVGKLKESGSTFIVTIDLSKLPKDLIGSLNDLSDCVVELSKDDSDPNGRQLKVQRLNQKSAKIDAETFEIDSSKGLVFV